MPRKYKKKVNKKRVYKKRNIMPLYKQSIGLGPKLVRMTRYAEKNIVLNPTVGGLADSYVFSANGLYDPNISAIGHQPIGFDQIMQFYDHYVVLGSKIRLNFRTADTVNDAIVGITLQDDATEIPNAERLIENGRCKWTLTSPANSNYGTVAKFLSMKCNPAKFLGRSRPLSDSQLKGSVSSNPVEQAFWHIFAEPTTNADAGTIQCHVVIDYIVAYIEPKTLVQS